MGRHSAPGDDEVDAGTHTGQGTLAVSDDTLGEAARKDAARRGRHSSPGEPAPDDLVADDESEDSDEAGDSGGLDLIEDALAGPDSGPTPIAEEQPAPVAGRAGRFEPPAAGLHDAPTERIPVVGREPDPALERTDRIPAISEDYAPGAPLTAALEPGVSESYAPGSGLPGSDVAQRDDLGPAAAGTMPVPPSAGGPRRGAAGDLRLIRRHGDVRARVIAAVIVPFLAFVAVFAVAGALTVRSLIWIWIPAVTAGVLVGLLLDAGHRRYRDPGVESATEPADPTPAPRKR